jgi:hypothetical protein
MIKLLIRKDDSRWKTAGIYPKQELLDRARSAYTKMGFETDTQDLSAQDHSHCEEND